MSSMRLFNAHAIGRDTNIPNSLSVVLEPILREVKEYY